MWIIVILCLILLYYYSTIEYYDERITSTPLSDCAKICQHTTNCYGFAYDKEGGSCYLSKDVLTGKPRDALYRDLYYPSNLACNKIQPIVKSNYLPTLNERRKNSIYVCRDDIDTQPSWYLYHNGTFTNIGFGKNLDEIYNVDVYETKDYDWPINKFHGENIDLLKKRLDYKVTKI